MTISTNDHDNQAVARHSGSLIKGVIADAITLVRIGLTPVIMFVIIKAWTSQPNVFEGFWPLDTELVLLASVLFAIAALTDIFDDLIGGNSSAYARKLGWFDDIADSFLIVGTLLSLVWVVGKAGLLHWSFAVPVLILFIRDIVIGLLKSLKFSKDNFQETRLGDIKNALAMLAVCLLVAAPWLSNLVDSFRAGRTEDISQVYGSAITMVWNTGLAVLWIAALLSLITLSLFSGKKLLTANTNSREET